MAQDIRTIAGGMANVDHIGPEAMEQLMDRFRTNRVAYLEEAQSQAEHVRPELLADYFYESPAVMAAGKAPDIAAPFVVRMLTIYRNAEGTVSRSTSDDRDRQLRRLRTHIESLEHAAQK